MNKQRDHFKEAARLIDNIDNCALREVMRQIYYDNKQRILVSKASPRHHTYDGGLLDHLVEVASIALRLENEWSKLRLNTDIIASIGLLHDIGKVGTIDVNNEFLEHSPHGLVMVAPYFDKSEIPDTYKLAIYNGIGSHMVQFDMKGDMCGGVTVESLLVKEADTISSVLGGTIDKDGWFNDNECFFPIVGRKLYRFD